MAAPRRSKKRILEREAWLILCEGQTEVDYFREFQSRAETVRLHFGKCSGGPKTMVQEAIRRWKGSRSQHDFDRVWCVADVDDHLPELVDQACRLAETCPGVRLVVSNPCIELWALLHFQEQTARISQEAAQRLLEKCCPGYLPKKRLPVEPLFELEPVAIAHARKLTPGKNPSTGIPDLIEALLAKGRNRG